MVLSAPSGAERPTLGIPAPEPTGPWQELNLRARSLQRARRQRNQVFGTASRFFGEPGWDLLLELFMAYADRRSIDVSATSYGAGVPLATGLRYFAGMEDAGLLRRWSDPNDKRRKLVELTPVGLELMIRYLGQD